MGVRSGPKLLGAGIVLDDAATRRVCAFVATVGKGKAIGLLRVGEATLEAAYGRSRMKPETAARLLAELERQEAILAVREAS
jgi:hypothetical protein